MLVLQTLRCVVQIGRGGSGGSEGGVKSDHFNWFRGVGTKVCFVCQGFRSRHQSGSESPEVETVASVLNPTMAIAVLNLTVISSQSPK